jgi:hypothetical protein
MPGHARLNQTKARQHSGSSQSMQLSSSSAKGLERLRNVIQIYSRFDIENPFRVAQLLG